jgi:predicted nucleotidyltransferase
MALTPEQQDLVDAIGRALAADPQIEAAWLAGSLGRGAGDAFSDVDVVALVADGPAAEAGRRWASDVARIAEPVLVNVLYGGLVLNCVASDWRRFDISFITDADFSRFDAARLKPLFNRGSRGPTRGTPEPYQTTPQTLLPLVNEFLRILGLLVVGLGREEYLLGLTGADLLRGLTVNLMLEENGVGPAERGGALRRNPLLTPEQRAQLASLTPVTATREGIITANRELAAIFLPRARRLGERIGMAWLAAFEAATRRHLQARLDVSLDEDAPAASAPLVNPVDSAAP